MRIALVTLLAGVGLVTAAAATGTPSSPAAVPVIPDGLKKCAQIAGAYCGSLVVPLDRTGATPGTVEIGFEWYPRTTTGQAALGTIVALEGGPGYSTTDSREYYLELFRPLLDRRALLLVDQRGTGRSDPINCPEAQSGSLDWVPAAKRCGERLGARSDLYTSANAARDLKAVLDYLGVAAVDVYGDSYGSFMGQTFAVRYPATVRTLVLDATYPISGLDPWYRTTATRLRTNLELACRRSADTCPVQPAKVLDLVAQVVSRLRTAPLTTSAPDGYGDETTVTLTPRRVLDVLLNSDSIPGYVREIPAALQSLLDGNPRPLARMVAESAFDAVDASEIRGYSEGAYLAYACSDYPQLWNVQSSFAAREQQYASAIAGLPSGTFAPWRNAEWADSEFFVYDYCINWPKPRVAEPPLPAGASYPNVPTLVLNGDLDLRTDVLQAREVARNFPRSTYVEVLNAGHVTALFDADACASRIARRFIENAAAGSTSCLESIPEHRVVQRFGETAAQIPQAPVVSSGDRSTAADRRSARVVVESIADVIDRWYAIPDFSGGGLYGGRFTMDSTGGEPFVNRVWSLDLNRIQWVSDVRVTGTGTVPRGAGTARVTVELRGAGTADGELTVTWPTRTPGALARVRGTLGGRAIDVSTPAPSFY